MALPTSGQLALNQIRDEFGAGTTSNVSLRTLSSAANLSVPDGFNEFYGLSAFTPPSLVSNGGGTASGSGTASSPYIITQTNGNFGIDAGGEEDSAPGCGFQDRLRWNYNYYTGAEPGQRATFQIQQKGPTGVRAHIKIASGSASPSSATATNNLRLQLEGFGTRNVYQTGSQTPFQKAISDGYYTFDNTYYNVGQQFDLRFAYRLFVHEYCFDEFYNIYYEVYNFNFQYPTINSVTYHVWFEPI